MENWVVIVLFALGIVLIVCWILKNSALEAVEKEQERRELERQARTAQGLPALPELEPLQGKDKFWFWFQNFRSAAARHAGRAYTDTRGVLGWSWNHKAIVAVLVAIAATVAVIMNWSSIKDFFKSDPSVTPSPDASTVGEWILAISLGCIVAGGVIFWMFKRYKRRQNTNNPPPPNPQNPGPQTPAPAVDPWWQATEFWVIPVTLFVIVMIWGLAPEFWQNKARQDLWSVVLFGLGVIVATILISIKGFFRKIGVVIYIIAICFVIKWFWQSDPVQTWWYGDQARQAAANEAIARTAQPVPEDYRPPVARLQEFNLVAKPVCAELWETKSFAPETLPDGRQYRLFAKDGGIQYVCKEKSGLIAKGGWTDFETKPEGLYMRSLEVYDVKPVMLYNYP